MRFFEVSSLNGSNLEEVFDEISKQLNNDPKVEKYELDIWTDYSRQKK